MWVYDDGSPMLGAPSGEPQLEDGDTALDFWQSLLTSYLDVRNVGVSGADEAFPLTTAGDVQRTAMQFSRQLCLPRYDFADLRVARDAWRDAFTRARSLCADVDWNEVYPENERFWLSDTLALSQRMAAVDNRRNAFIVDASGLLSVTDTSDDPLTLWSDLRQFYADRRGWRRDHQKLRVPLTLVRDIASVVAIVHAAMLETLGHLVGEPQLLELHRRAARQWLLAVDVVSERSRGLQPTDVYPANADFWRAAGRLMRTMSALRGARRGQERA